METVISTMLATCDRLLTLLTGPHAITSAEGKEAAEEAIGLICNLESYLAGASSQSYTGLAEQAIANLKHRTLVLEHIGEVLTVLKAQGLLP